jgi:hypothetical protein
MRNLIKKILKESEDELEWMDNAIGNVYIPKVGDVFYIPSHNYSLRITKIKCDGRDATKWKTQHTIDWGNVQFMDYGCNISYETNYSGDWLTREDYSSELGWIHVLIEKGYWVGEDKINEQEEDFSWVNLPETPRDDSYAERVRYALENTEFKFVYQPLSNGGTAVMITDTTENPSILLTRPEEEFTRKDVLNQSQYILSVLHKQRVDTHFISELENIINIHKRLYNILKQVD